MKKVMLIVLALILALMQAACTPGGVETTPSASNTPLPKPKPKEHTDIAFFFVSCRNGNRSSELIHAHNQAHRAAWKQRRAHLIRRHRLEIRARRMRRRRRAIQAHLRQRAQREKQICMGTVTITI